MFPCSDGHEQDWQPYLDDPYSAKCDDHTYNLADYGIFCHHPSKGSDYYVVAVQKRHGSSEVTS